VRKLEEACRILWNIIAMSINIRVPLDPLYQRYKKRRRGME
jgi:hypothetical protein